MVSRNKYLSEVFPKPPLTAFKKQPNIRNLLIRANVARAPERYPNRRQKGMKRCNRPNCTACPYINETKQIIINKEKWNINKQLDCNSYNVIYAIICKKKNHAKKCIWAKQRDSSSFALQTIGAMLSTETEAQPLVNILIPQATVWQTYP